ncbi:MAG: glycosyltransferase family 4 protein [Planctomycetes bacterium]|nr:glycosyltransferase family 4 protein [Planctomycetota bacterium]
MNVWIVNPFDPLPGDPEQEGRYATLARLLAARGHAVTWWTSAFSHRFKRPVDQAAILAASRTLGLEVRFLAAPPYERNVSIARLRNHRRLAAEFASRAHAETQRPAVIVASSPPPGLARAAMRLARGRGARGLVDVQDAWPDAFPLALPRPVRPLARLLIAPWRRTAAAAYRAADAIVGVADAYVELATTLGGPKPLAETIPLGVDLAAFDRAAAAGRCPEFTKPPGETWLVYAGSLGRNYDCLTILRAAAILKDRIKTPWRLFVSGRGEQEANARRIVVDAGLANVTLAGFMTFEAHAYLLTQCDVALNAVFPEMLIHLPNKIFYYMAAGAAILNTIPGQCSRIVREAGCGLDYEAGNPDSCAAAAARLIGDTPACKAMGAAARRLAETQYNRKILYRRYVEAIERVAAWR